MKRSGVGIFQAEELARGKVRMSSTCSKNRRKASVARVQCVRGRMTGVEVREAGRHEVRCTLYGKVWISL